MTLNVKKSIKRKSVKKWLLLLVSPIVGYIFVSLLQITLVVLPTGIGAETNSISKIINIISLLVGIISIIILLLSPLWMVYLVRDLKGSKRSKTIAILVAVFFSFFSWLYTYENGSYKFWTNFGLTVITFGVWLPIGWVWAIIDNVNKSDEYFSRYTDN